MWIFVYDFTGTWTWEVIDVEEETSESNFTDLLVGVLKALWAIVWWFLGIVLLFYIYYIISNKDPNIGFHDFIIDKTSWKIY